MAETTCGGVQWRTWSTMSLLAENELRLKVYRSPIIGEKDGEHKTSSLPKNSNCHRSRKTSLNRSSRGPPVTKCLPCLNKKRSPSSTWWRLQVWHIERLIVLKIMEPVNLLTDAGFCGLFCRMWPGGWSYGKLRERVGPLALVWRAPLVIGELGPLRMKAKKNWNFLIWASLPGGRWGWPSPAMSAGKGPSVPSTLLLTPMALSLCRYNLSYCCFQ